MILVARVTNKCLQHYILREAAEDEWQERNINLGRDKSFPNE